jgi:hypothetical protein
MSLCQQMTSTMAWNKNCNIECLAKVHYPDNL